LIRLMIRRSTPNLVNIAYSADTFSAGPYHEAVGCLQVAFADVIIAISSGATL